MSTKTANPRCKINFGNLTFRILILQTTWSWVFFCMILGLSPDSVLGSLSSKPPGLQRICMILGLNLDSICGSWSLKKGWDKCIQMSTKASNPECKINFGNLTFRILILQTIWFWLFSHDFGTKSTFSFGILILQTTWFKENLHHFGTKSRFSFGVLILQTTWFTAGFCRFDWWTFFIFVC